MANSECPDADFSKNLRRLYDEKRPALEQAKSKLRKTLRQVVGSIEDRDLVRAELRPVRIKEFDSFRSKALRECWSRARTKSRKSANSSSQSSPIPAITLDDPFAISPTTEPVPPSSSRPDTPSTDRPSAAT